MLDFGVRIKNEEDGVLKVSWSLGAHNCKPYFVSRDNVVGAASDLRAELSNLVSAQQARDTARSAQALQAVAVQGARLKRMFFQWDADGRNEQAYVERILTTVEGADGRRSVCFFSGARLHIPWGLMYSGNPPAAADAKGVASMSGFWFTKFRLATVYQDAVSPFDFDCSYAGSAYETLIAADQVLLQKITKNLSAEEVALLEMFLGSSGPIVNDVSALGTAWQNKGSRMGLFYFYGHADNKRIALSKLEMLKLADFEDLCKKGHEPPKCVVFLNGCYTASGDSSSRGFLEATGRPGFCGFIGAEAELPDTFALRFGIAFQKMFYEGVRLHDILDVLRTKHWPLSLLYGLYAYPDLRIEPVPGLNLPPLPNVNYSEPSAAMEDDDT